MENRTTAFLDVFRAGMLESQEKERRISLGDRSLYLGISDLAKYQECPRAAIAAKLAATSDDLDQLITFGRGHWFEQGVADSFTALGLKQMRQVEISCQYQDAPIKAHLDITLVWDKPRPAVRIVEIKSMEKLPDEPYYSHQWQIAAQTELLRHCWNKPAFKLADSGKMSFPELCQKMLGVKLPENLDDCSIEGWLLCLSMSEAKAFGPFTSDREFMEDFNIKALTMWRQLQKLKTRELGINDLPHAQGFYPLCSYCPVNSDCPKFEREIIQQELEPVLASLDRLKENRANLDAEIREIESGLKLAYENAGLDGWLNTLGHRFRVSTTKGRKILDRSLLEAELADLFHSWKIESDTVESFISRCEKEGSPCTRLSIQPIKQEE